MPTLHGLVLVLIALAAAGCSSGTVSTLAPPDYDADAAAKAQFEAFPPGCRREYGDWIGEAKREETRAKRIATTMANLREGKKLHWKYEGC